MADKMENAERDFYKRSQDVAQELTLTTEQLVRRLELVQGILADLKFVGAELARVGELAGKIERVAAGLRELREMENPPAPKDAA